MYSLVDVATNVCSDGMTTHGRHYVVADVLSHLLSVGRYYSHVADYMVTFWVDLFQFKF